MVTQNLERVGLQSRYTYCPVIESCIKKQSTKRINTITISVENKSWYPNTTARSSKTNKQKNPTLLEILILQEEIKRLNKFGFRIFLAVNLHFREMRQQKAYLVFRIFTLCEGMHLSLRRKGLRLKPLHKAVCAAAWPVFFMAQHKIPTISE